MQIKPAHMWWLYLVLLTATAVAKAEEGPPHPMPKQKYEIRMEKSVMVPMRDGVHLSTDLYFPVGVDEKLPVILVRTPYDKRQVRPGQSWFGDVLAMFVGQGYVVAVQDKRGRFESEGIYTLAVKEDVDGYDTDEWLSNQPWSNGAIGTYGCSDLGDAQVWQAPARHPALKAMIPQASGSSTGPADNTYRYFGTYNGGAFHLGAATGWMLDNGSKIYWRPPSWLPHDKFVEIVDHFEPGPIHAPRTEDIDVMALFWHLPVIDMMKSVGHTYTDWESILSHDLDDEWWDQFPYFKGEEKIDVPALFINSWGDFGVNDTLWQFNYFQKNAVSTEARDNQFVIISPTPHCGSERVSAPTIIGERNLGDARFDYFSLYVDWFDYWLKGEKNDVLERPKVQYYLMGANDWRFADAWPLPHTEFTRYYLRSEGNANTRMGDGRLSVERPGEGEPPDGFSYDPADPVPTGSAAYGVDEGFRDQRAIEMRHDVLVYTTEPLVRDVEVTGPVTATLYVSSSVPDTDFAVKLVDVYPDGTAMYLQEGYLRARYRQGFDRKVFMEPGEIYEIPIVVESIGNLFQKSHRIRIEVTSSNFPRFDRNMNTGGNNYDETEWVVAKNKIHHAGEHASYVTLPIVPAKR